MESILAVLKPLTPWQIVALAALVHSLVSGMWIGCLLTLLCGDTTGETHEHQPLD